jgi:hypothetical protein
MNENFRAAVLSEAIPPVGRSICENSTKENAGLDQNKEGWLGLTSVDEMKGNPR